MLATEFVDWISGVTNYLNSDNCPDSLRFGVANITEDMDILRNQAASIIHIYIRDVLGLVDITPRNVPLNMTLPNNIILNAVSLTTITPTSITPTITTQTTTRQASPALDPVQLKDLYDCRKCVNSISQVYMRGIMREKYILPTGSLIFAGREKLSFEEAQEIKVNLASPHLYICANA